MPFKVTTATTLLQTFQLWPKRKAQTPGSDNRRRLLEHVSVRTTSGLLTEIVILLYFVVNHTHRATAPDTRQNADVEILVAVTVGCRLFKRCQTTCMLLLVQLHSLAHYIYRRYGTQRVCFFLIGISLAVFITPACFNIVPHVTRMLFQSFVTRLDDSIVTVDLNRKVQYEEQTHPETGGLHGPFTLVKQVRFPTEDARFYCSFDILEVVEPFSRQFWWNKDGNQLEPSPRVTYDVTFEPSVRPLSEIDVMAGRRWYTLTSTLSIYNIDDNDFGSYTCHFVNFLGIVPNPQPPPYMKRQPNRESYRNNPLEENLYQERHIDNAKAEFQLIKQKTTTKYVVLPPGGVVKVTALHMTLEEDAEVSLQHSVNGVDEYSSSMCSGHEYLCSPAVMMYHFWKYSANIVDGVIQFKHSSTGPTTHFFYDFCVCSTMFGVHEFHVIRWVFNFTSEKYDLVETVYPKRLKIFPSLPGMFGRVLENESVKNLSSLETCWLENRNPYSPMCTHMLAEIQTRAARAIIVDTLVVIVLVMVVVECSIFLIRKLLLLTRNITLEGSVHPVVLPSLCDNPVDLGEPLQTESDYICEYDVFLVYSEEDRSMLPILKTCLTLNGLRVFDCHGDVQPGRQTVEVWDEILEKTASCLVVVSRNFTDNRELQDLFLTLYNRVLSSEMSVNRLLIVKIDMCPVSTFLGPLPFIDLSSGDVSLSNFSRMMDRWSDIAQRRIGHKQSHFKLLLWHDLKKELNRLYFLHRPLQCLRIVPSENAILHPLGHVELVTENITQFDYDVFFSYVEEDAAVAMEIKARLMSGGLRVFDTCNDVMLHEFPQIAIPHAVGHSARFVFIVSPEYLRRLLSCRLHFRLVWHQIWNTGCVKVKQVLLVKLGVWSVPAALRQFPLLNWNSSLLTPQDRLMTLDKWSVTALRNEKNQDLKKKI